MKLTANPFDPTSGQLLDVYRDAYLLGDLTGASARAVEAHLHRDADQAHSTVTRWHQLTTQEVEAAAPTTWVQKQLRFIQQQPQRLRQRATAMVGMAALIAGASMAGTNLPTSHSVVPKGLLTKAEVTAIKEAADLNAAAEASAARIVTVHGRILNEKGQPLAGATVLRKGANTGVSTNAQGEYSLQMTAGAAATATLQYGYGGYQDQEAKATEGTAESVTLQPRPAKRHRFLFF